MESTLLDCAGRGADPDALSDLYRAVMRRVAGSVSVILSGPAKALIGMTVNSVVSVSLDPPLILFCARARSATAAGIIERGLFSVNILGEGQELVARHFASGRAEPAAFDLGDDGAHVWLGGTVGSFLCSVETVHPAGDHSIIVGRIDRIVDSLSPPSPLIYRNGQYLSRGKPGDDIAIP